MDCISNMDIERFDDFQDPERRGRSPLIVATPVHRWVAARACRRGVRVEGGGGECAQGALWTRSIMHLLAGVVSLSHRRAIAPARKISVVFTAVVSRLRVEQEVSNVSAYMSSIILYM